MHCFRLSLFRTYSNVTFHYRQSGAAFFGGMCSLSRGVGVNEVRNLNTLLVMDSFIIMVLGFLFSMHLFSAIYLYIIYNCVCYRCS